MRQGIRTVKLKHLNRSGEHASGNPRFYYRPKGEKGVAMPDLPMDDPAFLAAYAKAAGVTPRAPVVAGHLSAAVALYKAHDDFRMLASGTIAQRRTMLDQVAVLYGHAPVDGLGRVHIEKDLSRFSGHARINHLKMWRGFCAWMMGHYRLTTNPSDGIKRAKTKKTTGHKPWSQDDIAAYRAHWPIGSMERLAFELIFWTGARISDAIRMGEGNIDRDGWLNYRQSKTDGKVSTPYRRALPDFAAGFAPDLDMLHRAISARNERHLTFLHTRAGASRSSKSVSQWFAAKARAAGLSDRTAHGLRKSRAELLIEAGASVGQGQAWIGHEDPRMLTYYAKHHDRRKALSKTEPEQKVPTSPIQFQNEQKR